MLVPRHDIHIGGRDVTHHHAASMAGVEDPAKCLRHEAGRVDNTRDVFHENVTVVLPILDSKELNVNVRAVFGCDVMVDDFDSRQIVFVKHSRGQIVHSRVGRGRNGGI